MIIIKQENESASLKQIQLDESSRKVDQLKDEINELQKQIVKLEAKADQQKD